MTKIIINTYRNLKVGIISRGNIFPTGDLDKPINTSMKVIRTATLEEYIKFIKETKLISELDKQRFYHPHPDLKFYLIEVLD